MWRASLELDAELAPVAVKVRFVVEEGYQPPQGVVEVVEDELGVLTGNTTRWRLAEDEDDDSGNPLDGGGLWIWGLFAEPLYPYLLVEFEHHALNLPGGRVLEGGLVQAKIPHEREKRRAKVGLAEATDGVTLEPGELRRRKVERVAADRIGLSQASVSTWEPCGAASIVPLAVDA